MTRLLMKFAHDVNGAIAAEKVLLGALALATVVAVVTASGADFSVFAGTPAPAVDPSAPAVQ